jgi:hypothetical protein
MISMKLLKGNLGRSSLNRFSIICKRCGTGEQGPAVWLVHYSGPREFVWRVTCHHNYMSMPLRLMWTLNLMNYSMPMDIVGEMSGERAWVGEGKKRVTRSGVVEIDSQQIAF